MALHKYFRTTLLLFTLTMPLIAHAAASDPFGSVPQPTRAAQPVVAPPAGWVATNAPCRGKADGTLCSDGNACTKGDVCKNFQCVGTPIDLHQYATGNPCEAATCNTTRAVKA